MAAEDALRRGRACVRMIETAHLLPEFRAVAHTVTRGDTRDRAMSSAK